MSKKHTKSDQADDRTELNSAVIAEMASDVAEIARRLAAISQKMNDRRIDSVSTRGVPSWKIAFKRMRGATGSIERALEDQSEVTKVIAEKRDQYKSPGNE